MLLLLLGCKTTPDERPNIVVIVAENLGWDAMGIQNRGFQTPHIDQLAKEAQIFKEYFNTSSTKAANLATLMVGQYEYQTGVSLSRKNLSETRFDQTYSMRLKDKGYLTAFVGDLGFESLPRKAKILADNFQQLPVDKFDIWFGLNENTSFKTREQRYLAPFQSKFPYVNRAIGAAAVQSIYTSVKKTKPFCITVSFKGSSFPFVVDKQDSGLFLENKYLKPLNLGYENGKHLSSQAKLQRSFLGEESEGFQPEKFHKSMVSYNRFIYAMDAAVGMIRNALKETGVDKNTILIFTSSNGFSIGNHGFVGNAYPYETTAKVPLLIYNPLQVTSQQACNALVGNLDISPTILNFAKVELPENVVGKSLLPLLKDQDAYIRKSLPLLNTEGPISAQCMAIVSHDFKYIYWPFEEDTTASEELYDRHDDALEMCNLATGNGYPDKMDHYRDTYDLRLKHWASTGIKNDAYMYYPSIFNRYIPWEDKKDFVAQPFWDAYYVLVE